MGILGVPYFGEDTFEIEDKIKSKSISNNKKYNSLYDMIQSEKSDTKIVVIVDSSGNEWYTYLRDIRFNYRDGEVYIPYYTYDIETVEDVKVDKKNIGHVRQIGNNAKVRHSYLLHKLVLDLDSKLTLYDLENNDKYIVSFDRYYSDRYFDIDRLYELYLDSIVKDEDYILLDHVEGYHLIDKSIRGVINYERKIRIENDLPDYSFSNINLDIDYRDVRNISSAEYNIKIGFRPIEKNYWERILDFESYIYCVLKSGVTPGEKFKEEWSRLRGKVGIVKYGDRGIKLIIKSYWLPGSDRGSRYTWSRV